MRSPTPKQAHDLVREVWGKAVRERRSRLKLTQADLQVATGISQGDISRIESGRYRAMNPDLVLRLCVALDAEPGDLFGWPHGVGAIAAHEQAVTAA